MSEIKKSSGMPEPGFLYRPGCGLLRGFLNLTAGLQVTGLQEIPAEGPVLLLMSHHGMTDFAAAAASCPRPIHFVATEHYFRGRITGKLLRHVAAIPKIQFHPDPRCIMSILRTLRAGRVVGIFPAGQTSVTGRPAPISPAIARLARKAGAAIVTLQFPGSYFLYSRFSGYHPGPMAAHYNLLYTAEQCAAMSEEALYGAICDALDYDEFAHLARTGGQYRGKLADGYEKMLWLCPACGALHTIETRGKTLRCTACGAAGTLGGDMRIRSDRFPETFQAWYEGPQQRWLEDNAAPIETDVQLQLYNGTQFVPAGSGRVTLTPETLTCSGTLEGKPWSISVENARQEGLFAVFGRFFELYDSEKGPVRFYPAVPSAVSLVRQAQALYFEKSRD